MNKCEYCDTMARFKIENLMNENVINGSKSGFAPNGKQRRFAIRIESDFREIELISKTFYENSKSIEFVDMNIEDIVENYARGKPVQ